MMQVFLSYRQIFSHVQYYSLNKPIFSEFKYTKLFFMLGHVSQLSYATDTAIYFNLNNSCFDYSFIMCSIV